MFSLKRLCDLTVPRGQQHVHSGNSVRCTETGVEQFILNYSKHKPVFKKSLYPFEPPTAGSSLICLHSRHDKRLAVAHGKLRLSYTCIRRCTIASSPAVACTVMKYQEQEWAEIIVRINTSVGHEDVLRVPK